MFISQIAVIIFFRLFNFVLLIVLGIYAYKKYGATALMNLITQKEKSRVSLYEENKQLEQEQLSIEKKMQEEELLCASLKRKVDEWQRVLNIQREQEEKEIAERLKKIKKTRKIQALHSETNRAHALVAQSVVHTIQTSLTHYFTLEERGKEYLHDMLTMMNERRA